MATLIQADGKQSTLAYDGDFMPLELMQKTVGGYIELLRFDDGFMVLNEEGKLTGLPVNEIATALAAGITGGDVIVGNVIICGLNEID